MSCPITFCRRSPRRSTGSSPTRGATTHRSCNRIGSKWHDRELRRWFGKVKAAAGFGGLDLHFHDLRGTLITWLLEAGCTEAEVGAISGHAFAKGNIRSYSARTRTLAENAHRKLAEYIEGKW